MRSILMFVGLSTITACPAIEPREVPAEIRIAVARRFQQAGIDQATALEAPGLFERVRISDRKPTDWLVDYAAFPDGRLCGTGGCPLQLWVGYSKGRYRPAFDQQVLDRELIPSSDDRQALRLTLHGLRCGATGSADCRKRYQWAAREGGRGRLVVQDLN